MENERPDWNKYFMDAAEWASSRASCPRATCGAAIVVNNRVIATGYNGAPEGHPQCDKVGCDMEDGHCQRVLHAEVNAIGQLAQGTGGGRGATMYIFRANTTSVGDGPCRECRKSMMAAGIWNFYTVDGPGSLSLVIDGSSYGRDPNAHPDCTFPKGHYCCVHGDCKGDSCCYHGTKDQPHLMNYVCGICNQGFPRDFYLANHMNQSHSPRTFSLDEVYVCQGCGYEFETAEDRHDHIVVEHPGVACPITN